MKYFLIVTLIVLVAVAALFIIKDNDILLVGAIITVIAGFWYAVFQIPNEKDL